MNKITKVNFDYKKRGVNWQNSTCFVDELSFMIKEISNVIVNFYITYYSNLYSLGVDYTKAEEISINVDRKPLEMPKIKHNLVLLTIDKPKRSLLRYFIFCHVLLLLFEIKITTIFNNIFLSFKETFFTG